MTEETTALETMIKCYAEALEEDLRRINRTRKVSGILLMLSYTTLCVDLGLILGMVIS